MFLLYRCCTVCGGWRVGASVLKGFPFFKDPLLIDVRVMRNRPIRVPADSTNFRHRIASFEERRNPGVLGLMKASAAQLFALGFFVHRFAESRQRFPAIENTPPFFGCPNRLERLRVKRNEAAVLPFDPRHPELVRSFEMAPVGVKKLADAQERVKSEGEGTVQGEVHLIARIERQELPSLGFR